MTSRCANCENLGTLYVPPFTKGVNLPDDAQEYLPLCLVFAESGKRGMLLRDDEGACEMWEERAEEDQRQRKPHGQFFARQGV